MKKVIGMTLTFIVLGGLLSGCYTRACEKAQLVYKEKNYHEEPVVYQKKGMSYHNTKTTVRKTTVKQVPAAQTTTTTTSY